VSARRGRCNVVHLAVERAIRYRFDHARPNVTSNIDRREAIRRISISMGAALSAPTVAGLLAGCEAPTAGDPFVGRVLSPHRLRVAEAAAEGIIPTTDTPGAAVARVHEFIDMILADFFPEAGRMAFVDGLDDLDTRSRTLFGIDFTELDTVQRDRVLGDLDAAAYSVSADGPPPFMRTLKELVLAGYYTSEIGQTVELRMSPFGPYQADIPLESVERAWA